MSMFDKAQAVLTLFWELTPNDTVGLSLGEAHLSKCKRFQKERVARSEGISCLRRSLSEDGCFGPVPCSIWFGPFTCSSSVGPCVRLRPVQRCTLYRASRLLPQRPSSSRLPGRSSPEASAFLGPGDQQLELCCHLVVSTCHSVPRVRTASGSQRTPGHVGLCVRLADLSPSSPLVLGRRERLQFVSWKCQFLAVCVRGCPLPPGPSVFPPVKWGQYLLCRAAVRFRGCHAGAAGIPRTWGTTRTLHRSRPQRLQRDMISEGNDVTVQMP